jgi:stage III sporulation protein AE
MKSKWMMIIAVLCFALFLCPVKAEETDVYIGEQLEESGANALWDELSTDTKALYEKIGVTDLDDISQLSISAESLGDIAGNILKEQSRSPLAAAGILLAAVLLCAYFGGWRDTCGINDIKPLYQTICVLGICGVMVVPFTGCIREVRQALSGAGVFMGSFSPVYIAILAAGGQLRTAVSYQSVILLFSQLLTFLTGSVLMPFAFAATGMGLVTAISDTGNLSKLGTILLKVVTWTLGIAATLFTTLLSVNSILGAAGDTLSSRVVKMSIASLVPVVGGALSEAYLTVKSCVGVVRSTVGAFGMVTTGFLILPSLIQSVCWQVVLFICSAVAEMFAQDAVCGFLKVISGVAKTMTAALLICGVFMIVATALVVLAGRGTT